ncbi:dihydrofolate reductase family protein [Mesorhizobium amorphae]|uniref:dihydrofolate reductase family protein n=1 Tax=Mesorhizobium amorphae TaxID=71433 RepID=UPI0016425440|nr:dihydrofolate reductase family protein [Mesorhizobium amorphae]
MTSKIIATQYISVDGVIQDPVGMEGSGLGDWTGPFSRGPKGDRFKHQELMNAEALILGRVTYDGFAAVWPAVNDPEGFAERINAMPKFVASRTLKTADWNNSTLIAGDLVDAATSIRAQARGDVLIYGSASIVHQLAPHGLIDEYRLMVYPTVLGRGIRLFPENHAQGLALVENEQFGDGITLLRYVKA